LRIQREPGHPSGDHDSTVVIYNRFNESIGLTIVIVVIRHVSSLFALYIFPGNFPASKKVADVAKLLVLGRNFEHFQFEAVLFPSLLVHQLCGELVIGRELQDEMPELPFLTLILFNILDTV
jgi:hypothetical protein